MITFFTCICFLIKVRNIYKYVVSNCFSAVPVNSNSGNVLTHSFVCSNGISTQGFASEFPIK
jgi:hypothetical protein